MDELDNVSSVLLFLGELGEVSLGILEVRTRMLNVVELGKLSLFVSKL